MTDINWNALAEPFAANEIEWRVGNKSKRGDRATLLCYLTSRAVQDRLDRVVGPGNWRDRYEPVVVNGKLAGFLCTLEIRVAGEWLGKSDISDITDIEALKGGVSGALKRAAVKWGIGRYLYELDARYHPIRDGYPPDGSNAIPCSLGPDKNNSKPGHIIPPQLPAWALPGGSGSPNGVPAPAPRPDRRSEPKPAQAANNPSEPEPTTSTVTPPAKTDGNDRASRLRMRVGRLEAALGDSVAELRRASQIRADSDLTDLDESALVAYGQALAAAAKKAA